MAEPACRGWSVHPGKERSPFWERSRGLGAEGGCGEGRGSRGGQRASFGAAAVRGGLFTLRAPLIPAVVPEFGDLIIQHLAVPCYPGVPVNFNLGLYPTWKTFPCIKQRFYFLITSQRRSFALWFCNTARVKSQKKGGLDYTDFHSCWSNKPIAGCLVDLRSKGCRAGLESLGSSKFPIPPPAGICQCASQQCIKNKSLKCHKKDSRRKLGRYLWNISRQQHH